MKIFGIFIALIFISLPEPENYKDLFNSGIGNYNKGRYDLAEKNFLKSYLLKQHSKTAYYIAICYYRTGEDSLALSFSHRALTEPPSLPQYPYKENLDAIVNYYMVAYRLRKIKVHILQSHEKEEVLDQEYVNELSMYYPSTPEGQRRLIEDCYLLERRSLPNEGEKHLDSINHYTTYYDPVIDSI